MLLRLDPFSCLSEELASKMLRCRHQSHRQSEVAAPTAMCGFAKPAVIGLALRLFSDRTQTESLRNFAHVAFLVVCGPEMRESWVPVEKPFLSRREIDERDIKKLHDKNAIMHALVSGEADLAVFADDGCMLHFQPE